MHRLNTNTAKGAAPQKLPTYHHETGCVVQIHVNRNAPSRGRYGYRARLDGKSLGNSPARFETVEALLAHASGFIADAYNMFGEVVVRREEERPELSVVLGGLAEAA